MNRDPEKLRRELAHLVNEQTDTAEKRTVTDVERRVSENRQKQINELCDELHRIANRPTSTSADYGTYKNSKTALRRSCGSLRSRGLDTLPLFTPSATSPPKVAFARCSRGFNNSRRRTSIIPWDVPNPENALWSYIWTFSRVDSYLRESDHAMTIF
jgi:hypothetical protein